MTDRNRTTGESMATSTGRYTEADQTRSAEIEKQFRLIRNEEVHRARSSGRLRTAVRKVGFQPNPN